MQQITVGTVSDFEKAVEAVLKRNLETIVSKVVEQLEGKEKANEKKWFDAKEAAEYLGTTVNQLYQYKNQGRIKVSKATGKYKILKSDLDKWIESNRTETIEDYD